MTKQNNISKIRHVILITVLIFEIKAVTYSDNDKIPVRIINSRVKIPAERAKEIIFSHAGIDRKTSRIAKLILNREKGIYFYEIIFFTEEKKYEYKVDANDGKVMNVRQSERNEHQKPNPNKGFFFGLF